MSEIGAANQPTETPAETIQLLVSDRGNRRAIQSMLSDRFDIDTSDAITDADLYLVEDRLLPAYREALRSRIAETHPVFCPVLLIRRDQTTLDPNWGDTASGDSPLLVDDVVDAPIDPNSLRRRVHSLFVRRRQSLELQENVSTLEQREQQLRRFERAVEQINNAVVITATDGTIEYVNPAFEALLGYEEAEVSEQFPRLFQPDEATDVFDGEFWRTVADRGSWEGEVVVVGATDQRYIVDTTVAAIRNEREELEGFVLVMTDITERIQRQQTLQNREQELDLLRQVLLRYLRHNLRNDLNVILGYAQLAEEALPAEDTTLATEIVEATSKLVERTETARQYSTLLARENELSSYDLVALVEEAADTVRQRYPDVDIQTTLPNTSQILAQDGIDESLEALIDNAAAHNDADAPWVRIRLYGTDGAKLVIQDNGPGIPDEEVTALHQVEETPLTHSSGLDLWLSKWVIEGAGGRLSFDCPDVGTRVTVGFPSPEQIGSGELDAPTVKERERRLETIIDRMTDAVIEIDSEWQITFVDRNAEEILGVVAKEIQGRSMWSVFPDAKGTELEAVKRQAMESRSSTSIESYYEGIDGWLEVHIYPNFDGGLSIYFRDITERRRQRQASQRREQVLREMHDIMADHQQSFSEQVEGLLELGKKELDTTYGTLSRIEADDYVFEVVAADDERIQSGTVVPLATTNCELVASSEQTVVLGDIPSDAPEATDRAGYTEWDISCYLGAPVFVGAEVYGTFCFYDTEPRSEDFSEWEITLVDLMSRWVSYELQRKQTTDRLERKNDQLERFASIVSHDLRNPLNILEGTLDLAEETGDAAHFADCHWAVGRMNDLIDDLLLLARAGTMVDELAPVALRSLVEECWQVVAAADATLRVETDHTIQADETRIQQLLENLFRNAVEHGGDDVTITVGELPDGFFVEDDGSGILQEEQDTIFESGYSTSEDGTGFGLAIVREIADAHEWNVRVTDSTVGGARFEVTGVTVLEESS